jgi:type II secretory pathway pseudopilin PulG
MEVLIALAILGTAGAGVAALAIGASDTVRHAQRADDEIRRASAFLDAVSLWPREDLDRHLGDRPQGEWRMTVEHPVPSLYTVTLADSNGTQELLRTALFRPRSRLKEPSANAR